MAVNNYPGPTEAPTTNDWRFLLDWMRQMTLVVRNILLGKLNNNGEITLTASAASTDLVDPRLTLNSLIVFDPLTANAAAEKAAGTIYVTDANRDNGTFTITHANNAQTDRDFRYAILG